MLRASRTPPGEEEMRWVYPKIILFVIGAALGIAGMSSGIDWLVNTGVVVLAAALVLRLWVRRRADRAERYAGDGDGDGEDAIGED